MISFCALAKLIIFDSLPKPSQSDSKILFCGISVLRTAYTPTLYIGSYYTQYIIIYYAHTYDSQDKVSVTTRPWERNSSK